jgi:hypothetical protein
MSGPLLVLILEDEALIAMTLEDDLDDAGYAVAGSFATCESVLRWLEHATRMSSLMPQQHLPRTQSARLRISRR